MKQIPAAPEADKAIRAKARRKVNYAVRKGNLPSIREQSCDLCGIDAEVYHHTSYEEADWLDVVPLCMSCHQLVHSPRRDAFVEIKTLTLRREMAYYHACDWMPEDRKELRIEELERRIYTLRERCG